MPAQGLEHLVVLAKKQKVGTRPESFVVVHAADLGLAPAAILFIDDNPENVARAAAAGLQTTLYRDRTDFTRALQATLAA